MKVFSLSEKQEKEKSNQPTTNIIFLQQPKNKLRVRSKRFFRKLKNLLSKKDKKDVRQKKNDDNETRFDFI